MLLSRNFSRVSIIFTNFLCILKNVMNARSTRVNNLPIFVHFLSSSQFLLFEASNNAIECIHEKNAHYRKLSRQIKAIFFLFDQITSTWFKANTTAFNISLCICNVCFFSSSLFQYVFVHSFMLSFQLVQMHCSLVIRK